MVVSNKNLFYFSFYGKIAYVIAKMVNSVHGGSEADNDLGGYA